MGVPGRVEDLDPAWMTGVIQAGRAGTGSPSALELDAAAVLP